MMLRSLIVGLLALSLGGCIKDYPDYEECADEQCETTGGDLASVDEAGTSMAGLDVSPEAGTSDQSETVQAYDQILIIDTTDDINSEGTPGVDICEVDIICDGQAVATISEIEQDFGESPSCNGENDDHCLCEGTEARGPCNSGIDRTNKSLTFDGDASCEGDNWASVGIHGYLLYQSESFVDCASIDVTVTEKTGLNDERYIVALCSDLSNLNISEMMFGDTCTVLGPPASSGRTTFSWSAPVE